MRCFRAILYASLMLLVSGVASAQQDYINIFAGSGRPTNIPATSAAVPYPGTVATDSSGNFYVVSGCQYYYYYYCDYYYYGYLYQDSVVKISSSGTLTILAGNGIPGYSGDGGPATQAQLNLSTQSQVAVDSSGNVYIADTNNCVIREVNTSGIISTFAGIPDQCSYGGDGGPATGAYLSSPYGVAVDSHGNVFIADSGNYLIREVSGGTINTVAGNGNFCDGSSNAPCGDGGPAASASLGYIDSLAVDGKGNVFTSDFYYWNQVVRLFTPGGNINTVAGAYNAQSCGQSAGVPCGDGGPATSASFNTWEANMGIASDAHGNLFIADFYNYDVREVFCADSAATCTPPGGFTKGDIYTVAGQGGSSGDSPLGGLATAADLEYAYGIAVDSSDDIFIPSYNYYVVNEVTNSTGDINTVAGNGTSSSSYYGNGVPAIDAALDQPWGVAFDSSGNAYIADSGNCVVREVNTSGVITLFAGTPGQCGYGGDGGSATASGLALLNYPLSVAVDSADNVYIADTSNCAVRVVNGGNINTYAGTGSCGYNGDGIAANTAYLYYPYAVAVDSKANVYIADTNNQRIREVSAGTINTIAGGYGCSYSNTSCGDGGPAIDAGLDYPEGVAVDKAGNVYVSDTNNYRVRQVNTVGIIDTYAGNGSSGFEGDGGPATQTSLYSPEQVAVDPAGDLIIADSSNQRIRLVDGQQLIHTVAGNGEYYGYYYYCGGTDVLATTVCLANPYGVGVDPAGNIYVGDTTYNVVQEVSAVATLNASRTNVVFDLTAVGATSGTQSLTLTAGGPLTISSITSSGPPFTVADNCGSGPPSGQSCTMDLVFEPTASGTFTGTVTVADNGFFDQSVTIYLTGTALNVAVSPTSEVFKSETVGTTSAAKAVKITNYGSTKLNMGTPTTTGDFAISSQTCTTTLNSKASCTISVVFKPTQAGPLAGSLIINDSDPSSPQLVTLSGAGASIVKVSAKSENFGTVVDGTTVKKTITLSNTSTTATLTYSAAITTTQGGNFTFDGTSTCTTSGSNANLAPGKSCTAVVDFDPAALGPSTGSLVFTDNGDGPGSQQTVPLTGTGKP